MRISIVLLLIAAPVVSAQIPFSGIFNIFFQIVEFFLSFLGFSINDSVNEIIQGACDSVLTQLNIDGLGCQCKGDVGALEAELDCQFQACLVGQFFCGGGSFATMVDVNDPGLENDFKTCLKLDAGLPVGSFDEAEVCYTAKLLNGMFNECEASVNAVGGILGGGTCGCTVCDNQISVSLDCSNVDIGIGPASVPGPEVDFCALSNFLPAV